MQLINNFGIFKTMNEAYNVIAKTILERGEKNNGTTELMNAVFSIENPMENLTLMRGQTKWGVPISYNLAELIWYYAGDNSAAYIGRFAKLWNMIKNEDGSVNSAYGYVLMNKFGYNQIDTVIEGLSQNPNSRRATLKFNTPHFDKENNINQNNVGDEVCTMYADFLIRDNKLYMTTSMRSNDIWSGLTADVLFFTSLQQYIMNKINEKTGEHYTLGAYTHFANSMHLYDRNLEKLQEAVDNYDVNKPVPGTIDFELLIEKAPQLFKTINDKLQSEPDLAKKDADAFVKDLCIKENILKEVL